MIYHIAVLFCGIIFGCGLAITKLINPNKILNFLDVTGSWDPSLAFVMLSAVIVTFIGYKIVKRLNRPIFCEKFVLPTKTTLDIPLIVGSAIFGIGWGLAGYCPGPAFAALGLGIMDACYCVIGMLIGSIIFVIVRK